MNAKILLREVRWLLIVMSCSETSDSTCGLLCFILSVSLDACNIESLRICHLQLRAFLLCDSVLLPGSFSEVILIWSLLLTASLNSLHSFSVHFLRLISDRHSPFCLVLWVGR